MMETQLIDRRLKRSKKVLVFNKSHLLIAILCSMEMTSQLMGVGVQTISKTCNGKFISCHGFYFRFLAPDIEVTVDDFGSLSVDEYDKLCGVTRKVRDIRPTARKRFVTT